MKGNAEQDAMILDFSIRAFVFKVLVLAGIAYSLCKNWDVTHRLDSMSRRTYQSVLVHLLPNQMTKFWQKNLVAVAHEQ